VTDRNNCWAVPSYPSKGLLGSLRSGPLSNHGDDASMTAQLALLRRERVLRPTILIGVGTCGLGAGAGKTLDAARTWLSERGIDADVVGVGCIGFCSEEPLLDIQLPGKARVSFSRVTADRVAGLLNEVFAGRIPGALVLGQFASQGAEPWAGVQELAQHPFMRPQRRWVLANAGIINPDSIDEYIACGGYTALERTLRELTPDDVCEIVTKSGLRGRGGGGFPAGVKWTMARKQANDKRYLICNADEGDPGAFMDRAVAESDPHRLLEGMAIAAYAIGAKTAYIYIRAEYPLAIERLRTSIAQATAYGLLGKNILNRGFELDVVIKMGAGAFVCGEETALMHSIEGKRGMPRPRPPFPAASGLFGRPTIINNVETLANVPTVIGLGAAGFAAVGTEKSKGTKVFALSGMVTRTGLVEVPMGTTIRQIVYDVGGGVPGGKRCKAVQIGGPSGGCIPEPHFDIETDYDALKRFGAIIGSGGLVVLDESTCMVDLAKFFMEFIQSESCGKCIPCREGTRRMLETLQAITRSRRKEEANDALLRFEGIMQLKELAEVISSTSLCGLGQTAPNPVLSTMRWFRDEYEAHIFDRVCPAGTCKELVGAPCQTGCPVGTEVWRYVAHVGRGELAQAYQTIREANPFPSVCARVCNHPCEAVCRCGTTGGEPIAVRALKRFVVDRADPSAYEAHVKPADAKSKRVAIIGAGPSGLTAAHYLSVKGYRVNVFEKQAQPGGMLLNGIPVYRLPREAVQKEIQALLNSNIELRCNTELGRDITVDGLLEDGFDAVYIALGAYRSHALGIAGEEVSGVYSGMQFLQANNLRGETLGCGRVGVVGGGNSAIDAARVALRQPNVSGVTVLYRRDRSEMPASDEEIEGALEEGIEIVTLVSPMAVLSEAGKLTGVRLVRNQLGEPDASGRRRPVPIPGSEFEIPLDTMIVAISEQPDSQALAGLRSSKGGTLEVNEVSHCSARAGVFGGGDVVRGPSSVILAIADGKRAALMMDRYLTGKQMRSLTKVRLPTTYIEPLFEADSDEEVSTRVEQPTLAVAARHKCFAEVDLSLTPAQASAEARRCLRCDLEFTRPST
jgi:NADH-quinone oxidoreductase subunit F